MAENNKNNDKLIRRLKRLKNDLKKRVKGKPGRTESDSLFGYISFIIKRILLFFVIFSLIIGFLLAGIGTGMLAGYISTAQPIDSANLENFDQTTTLLDMNGNKISELSGSSGSKNEFVPYDDFADTYIDEAFIAIEDERFLDHPGIDAKRIASSIFSAIANGGTPRHGGSTITQQTIKMISGADDISAQRKIQEWYSAIELEKSVSKKGILELYLNLVPMSNNITGIGAAANYYFNKNASDLSLSECAFLAGLPNQPAIYNPLTEYGRRNALRRMRTTLSKMRELGKISDTEYQDALNTELKFDFSYFAKKDRLIYSWFEEYAIQKVISDLITRNGYSPELARLTVFNQGLTIETTVDPDLQAKLEDYYSNDANRSQDPSQTADSPEAPQSAITVLENNPADPGRIRGMVGGFGKKKDNFIFNRASEAKRQPGSSIKPLVVYAPGLDSGIISDASIFNDKPVRLDPYNPDKDYPLNSYRSYLGKITLETALVKSTNTVAADLFLNTITPSLGLSYLKNLGIDRTDAQFASSALGGFEQGVSTLEMAAAFSAFPNKGIYVEPTCYTRVLRHDGTVLLDNTAPSQNPVFKPATCSVITKNLEKVAANIKAKPLNMHAAGKTGTSDDMIDLWFCGYTPYYTAAVWYGFDNTNGRKIEVPEVDILHQVQIWNQCMSLVHENLPDKAFEKNEGVHEAKICSETGLLASPYCPNTFTALLIDGSDSNPTGSCSLHKEPAPTESPSSRLNPLDPFDFLRGGRTGSDSNHNSESGSPRPAEPGPLSPINP